MPLEKWKLIAEGVGIIAVVLSLLLVAAELQQTQDAITSSALQARVQAQVDEGSAVYNSEFLPAIFEKNMKGEALSFQERIRFNAWFRSFNQIQEYNVLQVESGAMEEWVLNQTQSAVAQVFGSNSVAVEEWQNTRSGFSPSYREVVESTIGN